MPKYFDTKGINDFEDYLDQEGDTYLTIENKDKIVGGLGHYVNEADQSDRITWIFFHPDYSGHGLGTMAVKHCLDILQADPRVEQLVVRTSKLAYEFFGKFGYELRDTEQDHWGEGLDLYLMERGIAY